MTAPKRQNLSPRAAELIAQIYQHHSAGCCWHVVLDDDNWDCIESTRKTILEGKYDDGEEFECETEGACLELARLDVTASILARAREKAFNG